MALSDSGKMVSERHEAARNDSGKLTAGEVATRLRKLFPTDKITARELTEHAPEWHHSGFVPGKNAMGKTYFFPGDVDLDKLRGQVMEARAQAAQVRYFFGVDFEKSGKRWQPVAAIYQCGPGERPGKNASEITAAEYEQARKFDGETLQPYESFTAFFTRMTNPGE